MAQWPCLWQLNKHSSVVAVAVVAAAVSDVAVALVVGGVVAVAAVAVGAAAVGVGLVTRTVLAPDVAAAAALAVSHPHLGSSSNWAARLTGTERCTKNDVCSIFEV